MKVKKVCLVKVCGEGEEGHMSGDPAGVRIGKNSSKVRRITAMCINTELKVSKAVGFILGLQLMIIFVID